MFSFLINYMTVETPPIPASWQAGRTKNWIEMKTKLVKDNVKDLPALVGKLSRNPTQCRHSWRRICPTAPRNSWLAMMVRQPVPRTYVSFWPKT